MKKKPFHPILFFSIVLIASCKSGYLTSSRNAKNKGLVKIEFIITNESKVDSVFSKLDSYDLPEYNIDTIGRQHYEVSFNSNLYSQTIEKISNTNNFLKIYETTYFKELQNKFEPIIEDLSKLGSEAAKRYLNSTVDKFTLREDVFYNFFQGGLFIGEFSVQDTLEIINLLTSINLPNEIQYMWKANLPNDSLTLLLLEKNSCLSSLDKSIVQFDLEQQIVPIEFNKKGIPTKFGPSSEHSIVLVFDSIGTKKFYEFTKRNIDNYIAVVMNNSLYFCPYVKSTINTGEIAIPLNKYELFRFYHFFLFSDFQKHVTIKNILLEHDPPLRYNKIGRKSKKQYRREYGSKKRFR